MSGPFSNSTTFSSNNHIGGFSAQQMTALIESKCTNVVGAGVYPIDTGPESKNRVVCRNARASVVLKQTGADPNLPGPGQYVNPMKEGRDAEGNYKVLLSTQRNIGGIKFGGPGPAVNVEELVDAKGRKVLDSGPGPGQYINPKTFGRGPDGEVRAILSSEQATHNTIWFRPGAPRAMYAKRDETPGPGMYIRPMDRKQLTTLSNSKGKITGINFGSCRADSDAKRKPQFVEIARRKDDTPGPGHYIDPLKEGRNEDGEVKALLSNQQSVRTVKFGRPTSAQPFHMRPTAASKAKDMSQTSTKDTTRIAEMVLSTHKLPGRTVFAGAPYEGPPKDRPASAPQNRSASGTPGFTVLDGDQKVSSKYTNRGGARWGPPGR